MSQLDREIAEQPSVVARLLASEAERLAVLAREVQVRRPRFAVLAARGSSDNAARYGQHLLGRFCGIPAALATPSLHTLYSAAPRYDDALVIGVSQSGRSPDVVSVVAEAADRGAATVAITNDPDSALAAAAGHVVPLGAGIEASVAATKTYTASLAALAALVAALADDRTLGDDLVRLPDAIERQVRRDIEPVDWSSWRRLAVLGRGANYATAHEAALKIKELAGAVAEPYSPADFMHGPIAIVEAGYPVLVVAASGPAFADAVAAVEAVRARGGSPWVITDSSTFAPPSKGVLRIEAVPEWLSPIVAIVPAQRLAVAAAAELGIDADRPFGLEKVTLTR